MPPVVRALRGATTVDADTQEQVYERVQALLRELLARNGVEHEDTNLTRTRHRIERPIRDRSDCENALRRFGLGSTSKLRLLH